MLVVLAAFLFVVIKYIIPAYIVMWSTTIEVLGGFLTKVIAFVMCVAYKIQGRDVDMRA